MRAQESCGAATGREAPYRGNAKNQRQWLSTAISGSLALHICLLAASAFVFDSAWRQSEASPALTVYLLPAERPPPLPANLVAPPPDDLPVPVFNEAELRLPPPADLAPPPDFKSASVALAPSAPRAGPRAASSHAAAPPPPRPMVHEPASPSRAVPAPPTQTAAVPSGPTGGTFVSPGWDDRMSDWLSAHRTYPAIALSRREQGDVTVRFTVAGNGHVQHVAVVVGSGHSALDNAALAMLRGANVPAPGSEISRTVAIRYHLTD